MIDTYTIFLVKDNIIINNKIWIILEKKTWKPICNYKIIIM